MKLQSLKLYDFRNYAAAGVPTCVKQLSLCGTTTDPIYCSH